MTTTPKAPSAAARPDAIADDAAEPSGVIRLRLTALGVDYRADDFPARFIDFCEENDLYEMEVNEAGELIILPMVGFKGSRQETELNAELTIWRRTNGGVNASQTSRFLLPTGAIRGPDAAWITQERYDTATAEERETVFPGAPDFVVEIRSRTDNLRPLQRKMQIWMDGGARLGWLIDPHNRRVSVYRQGQPEPQILENPETLDGEDVLPGFSFAVHQYIFDLT